MEAAIETIINWFSDFQGCACRLPLSIFANGVRYPTNVVYMKQFQTCLPSGRITYIEVCACPPLNLGVSCFFVAITEVSLHVLCFTCSMEPTSNTTSALSEQGDELII